LTGTRFLCRASCSGRRFWEASRASLSPGSRGVLFLNLHAASGHRVEQGRKRIPGNWAFGVWLAFWKVGSSWSLLPGQGESDRSTHGRLPFPSHLSDEGCRASGADSSCFSNGSTQDESILVQQQRTCCSEWKWKKQHYCSQSDSSHVLLYRLQRSNSAHACPASAITNHESHPASGAVIHPNFAVRRVDISVAFHSLRL